jgi:hypothetical protein
LNETSLQQQVARARAALGDSLRLLVLDVVEDPRRGGGGGGRVHLKTVMLAVDGEPGLVAARL